MFRSYGLAGIVMILFVELNFFLKIQPFANFYFPIVWYGYILVIDALVYKLKGNSLISSRLSQFLGMIVISSLLWWSFEFVNLVVGNWHYTGIGGLGTLAILMGTISFSTVLPAFFETVELVRSIHLFDHRTLKRRHKITKNLLHAMTALGVICLVLPLLFPKYFYPLIWGIFFFLLDPINYLHKQPSIVGHLKDRKLAIPLSLLLAGIIMGFLWEFWNFWAIPKWTYDVPFVGFFKIFEMPLVGYLGYFPFAFELYAMYWFVRSLFLQKEHLLSE